MFRSLIIYENKEMQWERSATIVVFAKNIEFVTISELGWDRLGFREIWLTLRYAKSGLHSVDGGGGRVRVPGGTSAGARRGGAADAE